MQREHVAYALGRYAAKMLEAHQPKTAEILVKLGFNFEFTDIMAQLLNEAVENEVVNEIISERVIAEARKKK